MNRQWDSVEDHLKSSLQSLFPSSSSISRGILLPLSWETLEPPAENTVPTTLDSFLHNTRDWSCNESAVPNPCGSDSFRCTSCTAREFLYSVQLPDWHLLAECPDPLWRCGTLHSFADYSHTPEFGFPRAFPSLAPEKGSRNSIQRAFSSRPICQRCFQMRTW